MIRFNKYIVATTIIDDGVEVIGNIHDKQPTPATT